jgi:tripartite-type tricarboxylate transporter receptor subunit TctC
VIDHCAGIFKKPVEDTDLKKQMDSKGTEANWVGPEDFYKWAGETYAAHARVAIKIGMWKK